MPNTSNPGSAGTRTTSSVVTASAVAFDLAEGPAWEATRELLYWVDIRTGRVLEGRLEGDGTVTVRQEHQFDGTVGAVVPASDGALLIAGSDRLVLRRPDGEDEAYGPGLLRPAGGRRLNDGKLDPAGRFVVGSLSLAGPSDSEELFAVEPGGSVRTIDDDLTLANGLAWSTDGRTMYSADTLRRTVFRRAYDARTGATGERSVFVELADGYPDGMCLDDEGHLWVAVWGSGQVHRYAASGELIGVIDVPAPHVSSLAFAGRDLGTLVITTSMQDLDPKQLQEHPLSGYLFTCVPGARGVPQAPWRPVGSDPAQLKGFR